MPLTLYTIHYKKKKAPIFSSIITLKLIQSSLTLQIKHRHFDRLNTQNQKKNTKRTNLFKEKGNVIPDKKRPQNVI